MNDFLDILFTRTWWSYQDRLNPEFDDVYHWFNLFEGWAWVACSIAVLVRYLRHRKSRIETLYALLFFAFGLTDFREAYFQSSPLIWLKLVNLVALFSVRRMVITRYYPTSKLI